MGFRVIHAADADWRPSGPGAPTADLAAQLGTDALAARLWRLAPGQALARHRHRAETELYLVLDGTGRIRVGEASLTLAAGSAVLVEPPTVRQVFNDTGADASWLIVGVPPEGDAIRAMSAEELAEIYPDGLDALPPELA